MLNIKKYANGRFFDTEKKKYITAEQMEKLIKKGEKIKVTLTKTGKDVTASIIEQFSKQETSKKEIPFLKTDKLVKWLGETIDNRLNQVLDIVKMPTKEQVAKLDENIKSLNRKIDDLIIATESKKVATAKN